MCIYELEAMCSVFVLVRWGSKPKIVVDEDNKRDASPAHSSSPMLSRLKDPPEPLNPAPREIQKNKDDKLAASKEKLAKEDKKDKKDDKHSPRSPKEEKNAKKDKKKDKFKDVNDETRLSSERIIIGGEDAFKNAANLKSRLPHEVLNQFDGKSREVNVDMYNRHVSFALTHIVITFITLYLLTFRI